MILKRIFRNYVHFKRKYGTITRLKVGDAYICKSIANEVLVPKHHPGIIKPKTISLPPFVVQAITDIIQDYPKKSILIDSDTLARHLIGRVAPMEINEINEIKERMFESALITEQYGQSEKFQFEQKINDKIEKYLKKKVYNWHPINYNVYNSLLYLFARSAPEFAVLVKIFSEINARDMNFKPKSILDFGSGVGTVSWAARLFWKNTFEHFNVDTSADINDLAQTILQKDHSTSSSNLKGMFYRQFFPTNAQTYDLIVSAYSMLELPSFQVRMETILKLWNKTSNYLVIVEQGTNAGFKVINQIRDFLLQLKGEENIAHVFSPCPHDNSCPRFLSDNTPCNFEIRYTKLFAKETELGKERYSYVVFKKGITDHDYLDAFKLLEI